MNELFVSVRVSLHVLNNGRRGRRLVGILMENLFLQFRRSWIRRWSFRHGHLQTEKFYHYSRIILTFVSDYIVVSCSKYTHILIIISKLKMSIYIPCCRETCKEEEHCRNTRWWTKYCEQLRYMKVVSPDLRWCCNISSGHLPRHVFFVLALTFGSPYK